MHTFGAVILSQGEEFSRALWERICDAVPVRRNGNWRLGTLHRRSKRDVPEYVSFIGPGDPVDDPPLDVTVLGYCGDGEFVTQLADASAGLWGHLEFPGFEFAFAGHGAPIPWFHFFEGNISTRAIGDELYVPKVGQNFMAHLCKEELFDRRILRNIYPVNVFGESYFLRMLASSPVRRAIATGKLELLSLPHRQYGFRASPSERVSLFELFRSGDLIVEGLPADESFFSDDDTNDWPTMFPVHSLLRQGQRVAIA